MKIAGEGAYLSFCCSRQVLKKATESFNVKKFQMEQKITKMQLSSNQVNNCNN